MGAGAPVRAGTGARDGTGAGDGTGGRLRVERADADLASMISPAAGGGRRSHRGDSGEDSGSTGPPTELEASLAVVGADPGGTAREVAGLEELAGRRLGPRRELRLRDVYLDLPGEPLLLAGRAFRLRYGDGAPTVTLKGGGRRGDGPGVEREEREARWGDGAVPLLRRVAGEREEGSVDLASASAAAREGEEPLEALVRAGFEVLQDRETRRIRRDVLEDGGRVGELAVDEVRFDVGDRDCLHREIEVEAAAGAPGGRALLREAVDDLRRRFGPALLPWDRSKLATGRALVALLSDTPEPPDWLGPDGAVRRAGYVRVEELLEAYEERR